MKKRIEKITEYVSIIRRKLLYALEQQALLETLLFDEDVVSKRDNSFGSEGLLIVRNTLYESLAVNIASLISDSHKKVASLRCIIGQISDNFVREEMHLRFCTLDNYPYLGPDGKHDEGLKEIFEKIQIPEKSKIFNDKYDEVIKNFKNLANGNHLKRLQSARDKMIAHNQVKLDNSERRTFNNEDFKLKWNDTSQSLKEAKDIVINLELIVAKTHFKYDSSEKHFKKVAQNFWQPESFANKCFNGTP
ncbi:hypothetical protein [Prosthecochloris vibrioformis]|uniref:HEPN AbiU2-like domain-containing protein n=1 Tax=Prosthecochloris vibrioformis TaxID=1098 RepID=A0A5C4RQV0_PROVB|nr:hypothetical protein [Prosthecochloris vibrioformis]TNJ33418.1 hypothetical protein FGF68_10780 [Prosthecochloris vibrioformis]